MNIAFVLSTLDNSGPFIVARDIINNIVGEVNVHIYYLKDSQTKLEFNAPTTKIRLRKKTDFSNYDIVHSHGFIADCYCYLNRNTIKKCVTTLHQEIKPQYSLNYNKIIGAQLEKIWLRFIRNNDRIITLSECMCLYYQARLKTSNIVFVHNGIRPAKQNLAPVKEFEEILSLKNNYKILGVSASLTYRKGIDQVINALYLDAGKNYALLVIGDGGEKEQLMALAKKLNVEDRCLFIGHKTNAINYFQYFDIYVMCSRLEAFGLCVIEAASQKVPLVCSDLPIFEEIFNPSEIVTYKLDNISSLLNSIQKADKDKGTLSEKAYLAYINKYTDKIMTENYLKQYKALYISHKTSN